MYNILIRYYNVITLLDKSNQTPLPSLHPPLRYMSLSAVFLLTIFPNLT